jgi:ketosteroid isomerase-like protein
MSGELESALRVIVDEAELRRLLARLCRAVDRGDAEGIVACYTEDGFDDHGPGIAGTPREFADRFVPMLGAAKVVHHDLTTQLFEIKGDRAVGETYFTFGMLKPDGGVQMSFGRYVDKFRRDDGRWLIHHRTVISEWSGTVAAEAVDRGGPAEQRWSYSRRDPAYDLSWLVA